MTTRTAETIADRVESSERFCTFSVADLFFGIDVLRVQEVLRFQPLTRVPKAPEVIQGLMNLRGQIVTAIDMRGLLHLPARGQAENPMNVVIRTESGAVSLLVDDIGDVLDLEDAAYEPPPANLDATTRKLIRGIFKLEQRLLLILDPEQIVEAAVA
jgi:purine-binding chemotaxis protein CheW